MPSNTRMLESELDKLYWHDPSHYILRLEKIKDAGYKVLRNSAGKHKLQIAGFEYLNQLFQSFDGGYNEELS